MALGRTSPGGYLLIAVVIAVIGGFLYLAFFAPGESYTVHVTIIDNATFESGYDSVYIGHDIYSSSDKDKQISSSYYMTRGQVKKYDLSTKFLYNSTPSFRFDVVDGDRRIATSTYNPRKKDSNLTLEWNGKILRQVSSS